jgi:hypothetical protein
MLSRERVQKPLTASITGAAAGFRLALLPRVWRCFLRSLGRAARNMVRPASSSFACRVAQLLVSPTGIVLEPMTPEDVIVLFNACDSNDNEMLDKEE